MAIKPGVKRTQPKKRTPLKQPVTIKPPKAQAVGKGLVGAAQKALAGAKAPKVTKAETTVVKKPFTGSPLIPKPVGDPMPPLTEEGLKAEQIKLAEAAEQQALDLLDYQEYIAPQDLATELDLGDLGPGSLEEMVGMFKEKQEKELAFLEKQQAIQEKIEQGEFSQMQTQGAAQVAAMQAGLAPGREGFIAGTAPSAISEFDKLVGQKIDLAAGRLELAKNNRVKLLQDLKDAQMEGKKDLVKSIQSRIAAAELEIDRASTEKMAAQAQAVDAAMAATDNFMSIFESMGSAVANLSIPQLSAMIENTTLTMPAALTLQKAVQLEAEAAEAKTQAEADYKLAQADKLRKETEQIGVLQPTAAMQEFEFLQDLSPAEQQSFMELKRQKPNLQFMTLDDGSVISIDPQSGQTNKIFTPPQSPSGIPVGDFNNTGDLPAVQTKTTSAFGDGVVTAYGSYTAGGEEIWRHGLDFRMGERGSEGPVVMPFDFEVIRIAEDGGFGQQVRVRNVADGREMWISHLSAYGDIEEGQTYGAGTVIGNQGTTDGGTGVSSGQHLDITMPKADGGYYTPQQVASYIGVGQQVDPSQRQYSLDQLVTLRNLYKTTLGSDKKITGPVIDSLKDAGLTSFDLTSFDPDKAPLPQMEVDELTRSVTELQSLLDHDGFSGGIGMSISKIPFAKVGLFPGDTQNFLTEFKNYKAKIILPLLDKLKGAMSDKDLAFLESASTELDTSLTEERFRELSQEYIDGTIKLLEEKGQYDPNAFINTQVLSAVDTATPEDILSGFDD